MNKGREIPEADLRAGSALDVEPGLVDRFRDLSYDRYGIHFQGSKTEILRMKLCKMASVHGFTLRSFFDRLSAGESEAADVFLKEIAVGHTFFFRESAHFTHLVSDIRARRLASPLIWCAASSTGEEPYSIVISLLEAGIENFRLLASDVNPNALKAMHRGRYNRNQLEATDKRIRSAYFTRVGEFSYAVSPELRKRIAIKRINLHEPFYFDVPFDYVFCRNVMIYFDEKGREKVLHTLVGNLAKGGILYVGHSEALLTMESCMRKEGPAMYRKGA